MPNSNNQTVIAIDGSSASGKSTLSERLANEAGAVRLEYSLIFRALALQMIERGFNPEKHDATAPEWVASAVEYTADLCSKGWPELEALRRNPALRDVQVSRVTPYFSGHPDILAVADQAFASMIDCSPKPVVAEGRTIGRYVFPKADVKLFVDAELTVRATRRHASLTDKYRQEGKPFSETVNDVAAGLQKRDRQDQTREYQPTTFDPECQFKIDTSRASIDETLASARQQIDATLIKAGRAALFAKQRQRA